MLSRARGTPKCARAGAAHRRVVRDFQHKLTISVPVLHRVSRLKAAVLDMLSAQQQQQHQQRNAGTLCPGRCLWWALPHRPWVGNVDPLRALLELGPGLDVGHAGTVPLARELAGSARHWAARLRPPLPRPPPLRLQPRPPVVPAAFF